MGAKSHRLGFNTQVQTQYSNTVENIIPISNRLIDR